MKRLGYCSSGSLCTLALPPSLARWDSSAAAAVGFNHFVASSSLLSLLRSFSLSSPVFSFPPALPPTFPVPLSLMFPVAHLSLWGSLSLSLSPPFRALRRRCRRSREVTSSSEGASEKVEERRCEGSLPPRSFARIQSDHTSPRREGERCISISDGGGGLDGTGYIGGPFLRV